MARVKRTLILYWSDVNGATLAQPVITQDQLQDPLTAELPLIDAIQALSRAGLVAALLQEYLLVEAAPTSGPYASLLDTARFAYLCADGETVYINIPAPNEAIFSDGINVDLSRADVQEMILQAQEIAAGLTASPIVDLVSAKRGIIPRQTTLAAP